MKLHTVGYNPNKVGGAHSFLANLRKCFDVVETPEEADIFFITAVSMLEKLSVIPRNKKVVVRIDNILKRSCNRDIYPFEGDKVTMMQAMKLVAERADLVVYQSEWSKKLLDGYLKPKKSVVILNSGDESIFNLDGAKLPTDKETYFYSRSSNHDNKQWHRAYYYFQELHKQKNNRELWIAGRFSPVNIPNSFDFFNGEAIKYLGFIGDPEVMATYFRSADHYIYSYHMDCCSNTLIEAILAGCNVIYLDKSGGAEEIKKKHQTLGREFFYLNRMKQQYKRAFEEL